MYVCRAQDNIALSHCAEQALRQCEYCEWYESGCGQPHYPVPAVIYDVYHNTPELSFIHIWERTGTNYYFNKLVKVLS